MSASFAYLANRQEYGRLCFVHQSARASCELRDGILHIDYTGAISQASFHALDLQVLSQRRLAPGALERMDKALTLIDADPVLCDAAWPEWTPPSAVIVRPDQRPAEMEFCRRLALRGIARTCWLESRLKDAREWVS